MTELLEEKGLKVLVTALPKRVFGFTCLVRRPKGKPPLPVIVVNMHSTLERRRLTLGARTGSPCDGHGKPLQTTMRRRRRTCLPAPS
jgi:hypothetical protein